MKFMQKMNIFKKLRSQGNMTMTVILILGIIAVLNFISLSVFLRLDLTQNKDYSISKVSKRTVASLDDVVNINVYFSRNLPPKFINLEQEVRDTISEYENYSGGKIRSSYIDPTSFTDPVNELSSLGIAPLQFNVMRNDSYEVVQGFMGMTVSYRGKTESIPVIQSSQNLEYVLTTTIKKLTADKKMTVGLVSSHGTVDAAQYAENVYNALEDLYYMAEVDLRDENETLESVDTLVIIGPREPFEEADLKKIDDFIMSGRPAIMLVDGVVIDPQTGPKRNRIGLDTMLNKYGLKLNNDLIADVSNSMVSIPTGFFNVNVNYPLWPKVMSEGFDKENAMVSSLESLTLPWVSSIELMNENIDSGKTKVDVLVRSTEKACAQTSTFDINPQNDSTTCSETAQYDFAVYLSGLIKSAYNEGKETEGRLILVADSDFATDQFYAQYSDNTTFLQNLVDGVTLDEDLISIRSQGVTERPIKTIEKGTKEFIRYANIFGMTVLVLIFGLLRYFLRRKDKFSDQI